ncbi:MAG: hypothetical protein Q4B50_04040 [Bacillota bacterium]|nr:hypothetical protein [Bacillota bacterium]
MDIRQDAIANKTQLEALSQQIEELLAQIKETKQAQSVLDAQVSDSTAEAEGYEQELKKLRAQQKELIEEQAKETKEEAELRIAHNKQSQKMEEELSRERQSAEKELAELNRALDEAVSLSDRYILEREETLAEKNKKNDSAQHILDKNAAAHKILQDELNQINQQLKDALKAAAIRRSVSHIERESAENAVSLAQKALEETEAAMLETEEMLALRRENLNELMTIRSKEMQDLRISCEELIAEAREEEKEASRAFISKKQELSKAQSLADLTISALSTAEENNLRMHAELQSLYQQAEREAQQINSDMEEALKRAVNERNNYTKALSLAEDIELDATNAIAEEKKIRDQLARLNVEVHDLRNAALVAQNLVKDATIAKSNSDPDMAEVMLEMERALAISAQETSYAVEAKEAELAETEKNLHNIASLSQQKQQALSSANKLMKEAEQRCLIAERAMFELSVQAENRSKNKLGQMIANKRSAYEQAQRETKELKAAATNAENNLRTVKNEANKVERNMTVFARNAAQTIASSEKSINEAEQNFKSQLSEARALVEITTDKLEKLRTARTSRLMDLEQCQDQLQLRTEIEEEAVITLEKLNNSAQERIQDLKKQLEAAIEKDNSVYEDAKKRAEEASEKHENILRESITVSDNIITYQEQLAHAKHAFEKLMETQHTKRQAAQNLADYQEKEKAAICHNLEKRLAILAEPLHLAELNLQQRRKAFCQMQALGSAYKLRLQRLSAQLAQLTKERDDLSAAEERRAARQAEEERLEAARAAQLKAKLEEEAYQRQMKEQLRLSQELEAAHIAAEGVRAREAAAQFRAKEAANAEAIRLAAGQFLSAEDNLRLITSGELASRIDAMSELARQEVNRQEVRWVSLDEAADMLASAKQARMSASLQEQMFSAAQTTYNSICSELEDRQNARKKAGQDLASAQAALYRAERQKNALTQAVESVREVASCMDKNTKATFSPVMNKLQQVFSENADMLQKAKKAHKAAQEKISQNEQDIIATQTAAAEAQELLNEIANKWIYSAYQAVRLEAGAEVMQCEVADRNEIASLAQQRFEAAKKAAEEAGDGEERIGSVQKRRKKKKKKN